MKSSWNMLNDLVYHHLSSSFLTSVRVTSSPSFSLIVHSFPGMLISACSRQCVLKLKDYSDKKTNPPSRSRSIIDEHQNDANPNLSPTPMTPLVSNPSNNNAISNDSLPNTNSDRSLLGRLLNCKPCKQVIDTQDEKTVCSNKRIFFCLFSMKISSRS